MPALSTTVRSPRRSLSHAPLPDAETIESGIAWKVASAAVEAIPRGSWTTYGNVATVAGTHPVPLGVYLSKAEVPNAWRVLQAAGTVSPGFRWVEGSEHAGREPHELLTEEGVAFDSDGRAGASQKLSAHDLAGLVGVVLEGDEADSAAANESEESESAYLAQLASRFAASTIHGVIEVFAAWRSLGGYVTFGSSADVGAFLHVREPGSALHIWPLVIYSNGSVEVVFQWLANRPPFDERELREELRKRLNRARDVDLPESKLESRPSFSIEVLADLVDRTRVIEALEWFTGVVGEYDRLAVFGAPAEAIKFSLDGASRELSRTRVVESLQGHSPAQIVTYWANVDGSRWPVKQAFSIALDIDPSRFNSPEARRHLHALGFVIGTDRPDRDPDAGGELWSVEDLRRFAGMDTTTSATIGKILDALAARPDSWSSTTELAGLTGVERPRVRGAFSSLTRQLKSHFDGQPWMLSFAWGPHLGRGYAAEGHYRLTPAQAARRLEARG
ncbi:MGMT family protein [Planococcus sp. APC 4015]|nr:MGMT family protein [Planococcus sp. APC 4015]